ncbi:uncharacterized protein LOC106780756 [Vigna radiata var. radiata]|uniref:Uncharacterized protein LOC106780756 n=1 Tax=Vigna radiata var. radiata TaxID=3916 RepID=A0A1S3W1V8_VIGRR|nr:uncharacterized protein LOC106780756 [Vigna radiata var. radiata]
MEECKVAVTRSKRRAEKEIIEIESSEEEEDDEKIIDLRSEGEEEGEQEKTKRKENHHEKFREIFNQVIVVPLAQALHQIPIYSKRIKYYLGDVIDLDEEEIEKREVYTRPKKRKHPTKMKDPGSLTLPSVIGDVDVGRAMLDSGSNINMMSVSYLKKIRGLVLKPSNLSVMVADGSTKWPIGMVEDVIVRVEHLEFLVDFIVMDMDTNERIPVILGRPFMRTAKLLMSIYEGRIMLKDQENVPKEEDIDKGIHLNLKKAILQPGAKVKYKKKEWLVKELKEKGVVEIERPYSRLPKEVDRMHLKSWWAEDTNVGEKT